MKHALGWTGICMCLQLLAGCVGEMSISGAGGQTTNGIRIGIMYPDGNSGTSLPVRVRPAGYLADLGGAFGAQPRSVVNGMTDEAGVFTVDSLDGGAYVVEVNDGRGFAVAIVCHTPDSGGSVDAGTHTLAPTGVVRGHVPPEELNGKSWHLQVYGLERTTAVDLRTGAFAFTDMPAGRFTFRRISSNSTIVPIDFSNVQVRSNDTTAIPTYPLWSRNAVLTLNTTYSGAAVSGTVTDFPLLIRLNSANFPFGQAKSDGGDLRFAKSNGAPLPYEIERWDPVAGLAEVWVKVDTVYGNDSTQSITMYCGNPNASDNSNGAAVFDTANSFQGVWHLNENGDTVYDATADAFHGANSGSIMAAGIIGNSRKFADGDYLKISGLLNSPSSVTLSAWVQSEKSTGGQDVISIGDAVIIRLDYFGVKGASGWFHNSPITSDDSKYAIDSSGIYLANTGWHYLTYAINGETHVQTLYIDGVQSVTTNDTNPIYYAGLGADTYIGIHGNGKTTYNFGGQIDEVRVSNIALSADWIKLCYMNQKEQDALVVFK